MLTFLILVLLQVETRNYHQNTVTSLHNEIHPHVVVNGTVCFINHEGDGDFHFRICDENKNWIVAEVVPTLRANPIIVLPKLNDKVSVKGIHRYDGEHKWDEIHPVESITVLK